MNKIIKVLIPLILFLMSFLISFLVSRSFNTDLSHKNDDEKSQVSVYKEDSLPQNDPSEIYESIVPSDEKTDKEESTAEEKSKIIVLDENGDPVIPKFYKKLLSKYL